MLAKVKHLKHSLYNITKKKVHCENKKKLQGFKNE